MDQGDEDEPEQARNQKADAQIHGRLDHDGYSDPNRRNTGNDIRNNDTAAAPLAIVSPD